ncbi:hypothetical protein [Providencia rettgeri]|uniref:hypothetical protein n=1 Tax=Providencia rettgeri TaxID=587 RepID=UPI00301B446D
MAGISTLGIGSNLDLNVQMDQLEAMERRRLEPLSSPLKSKLKHGSRPIMNFKLLLVNSPNTRQQKKALPQTKPMAH